MKLRLNRGRVSVCEPRPRRAMILNATGRVQLDPPITLAGGGCVVDVGVTILRLATLQGMIAPTRHELNRPVSRSRTL